MPVIKKPNIYRKPEGYKTPKQIIESTSDITKTEAFFTKKKGPFSKLEEIGLNRSIEEVFTDFTKLKDRSYHSHILVKDGFEAIPSIGDITSHLDKLYSNNINIEGIFVIDPKTGQNIGRTFFTFTSKTDKIITEEYKKYKSIIADEDIKQLYYKSDPELFNKLKKDYNYYNVVRKRLLFEGLLHRKLYTKRKLNFKKRIFEDRTESPKKYIELLDNFFGIKIRFVPMPGYEFNNKKMIFEKLK